MYVPMRMCGLGEVRSVQTGTRQANQPAGSSRPEKTRVTAPEILWSYAGLLRIDSARCQSVTRATRRPVFHTTGAAQPLSVEFFLSSASKLAVLVCVATSPCDPLLLSPPPRRVELVKGATRGGSARLDSARLGSARLEARPGGAWRWRRRSRAPPSTPPVELGIASRLSRGVAAVSCGP